MDLNFYIKLFIRRLPYLLILLALGTAVGVTVATILPPVYSSRATLVVENQQIPGELAASTVQTDATEALQIIRQRILTRERLLKLAEKHNVYGERYDGRLEGMTPDDMVRDLRGRIEIVSTGGERRGQTEATILNVGFSAPAAELSADVVNDVVSQILEENLALRRGESSQTLEFFESEVERLDRALAWRESQLLAFQEENLDALPESLPFRRERQTAIQERLTQLQREESALRDRRNRLVTLYETTGEVATPDDRPQSSFEILHMETREELALARIMLADDNPRIRSLEARAEALSGLVAEEQAARRGPAPEDEAPLSSYEVQLADIESQLDTIAEQRERMQRQLEAVQASIEATPGNAMRLGSMQRDFEAIRQQYEQAVANRARAATGDVIENLAKGQRITVIEPAVAPSRPTSPNRPLIAAAGMGAGLAAGLGLVVLLELLNSAVRRPEDLQSKLGFVAFGALPLMRTPAQIMRRRVAIGCLFLAVALGAPAGLWYLDSNIVPLDQVLEGILNLAGVDRPSVAS
jgi:uncharacterized protein involved in exopolysaccharide biosynthesis